MCGICGFRGNPDTSVLERMCHVIAHRGPDDEGHYLDEDVALGVRRLSIIDIQGGRQPIHNEDGTIWVGFNGEVYNFQELRGFLERKGHRFYTRTDTEVIVHLYEEYGEACVHPLRGMFAFAIWDRRAKKLFLARDRLGIKPLYYTNTGGKLVFGSEIKAILEHPDVQREVDLEALDLYLTLQYVPAPLTMFKGIYKLPPGHYLVCEKGELRISRYWDVVYCDAERFVDEDSAAEEFLGILKEAVRLRLISDVPLGALLSGGIDSATVVALMSGEAVDPVRTFTVGFDVAGEYNELKLARLTARRFEAEHREVIVRASAAEVLPKLIWHMDEPVADQAALPTYLICRFARQFVTVVLTGEGGDELLGGYPRYAWFRVAKAFQRFVPSIIREGLMLKLADVMPIGFRNKKRLVDLLAERDDLDRHLGWVGNFPWEERQKLYKGSLKAGRSTESDAAREVFERYLVCKEQIGLVHSLMYLDLKTWLVDDILTKVDKMSMAVSLEARVPLLDHKLVEFVAGLPSKLKVRSFGTKRMLRKAMQGLLPKAVVHGKKHAFLVPATEWFRGELAGFAKEVLLSPESQRRRYFDHQYVRWMVEEHAAGRKNFGQQLWNLLCLELWHQIFIDRELRP